MEKSELRFHQSVMTPKGLAVIQGWMISLKMSEEPSKILVSIKKNNGGIWDLYEFEPEELSPE